MCRVLFKNKLPPERCQHLLDQQQHTAWALAACEKLKSYAAV